MIYLYKKQSACSYYRNLEQTKLILKFQIVIALSEEMEVVSMQQDKKILKSFKIFKEIKKLLKSNNENKRITVN